MKKQLFTVLAGITLLLSACKEIGPEIRFTDTLASDSTYVAAVPPAQAHNVLVEEFSGETCPNCPAGEDILLGLYNNAPQNVNIITMYVFGLPQTKPLDGAINLCDSSANKISAAFYGSITALPCAGFDRLGSPYATQNYSNKWSGLVSQQLSTGDSVNLALNSTYNSGTGKATITATITYLYPVSTRQNLTLALVQDSIVSLQENQSDVDSQYVFLNVFRDAITYFSGDPVLDTFTIKEPGRVDVIRYTYDVHQYNTKHAVGTNIYDTLAPQHCRIVGFVAGEGGNNQVWQSAQTKLTGL